MIKNGLAILCAILAAVFYAINIPISKVLLTEVDAVIMAAFLYLGAGLGMLIYRTIERVTDRKKVEYKSAETFRIRSVYLCAG
jgi:drug/metabolite transporter (DMT)-like permease